MQNWHGFSLNPRNFSNLAIREIVVLFGFVYCQCELENDNDDIVNKKNLL